MNAHERTKEQLVRFALGELPERERVEVSSHVNECQECRIELERLQKVLACAGQLNELSVDEQMCESAGRDVLLAMEHQQTQTPRGGRQRRAALIWRLTMKSSIGKIAVAAIVAVAAVIGIFTLGHPAPAFADIVRPILAAHTAIFKVVTHTPDQPAITMEGKFMDPGRGRHTIVAGDDPRHENVMIMDYVQGKGLVLVPSEKTAMVIELEDRPDGLEPMKMNMFKEVRDRIMQAQENPGASVEYLGESRVNGRETVGYRMSPDGTNWTIWADAETLLPLQVEFSAQDTIGPSVSVVMMDIQFDVPLDPAEFSTDVPEGYAQHTMTVDASTPTEVDLIETLVMWVEVTDGRFPRALTIESTRDLVEALKAKDLAPDVESGLGDPALQQWLEKFQKINRALLFVRNLPEDSDRHYAGADATFGDEATPVFWYRPEGSATYRVIYADLSVLDVAPDDLPE